MGSGSSVEGHREGALRVKADADADDARFAYGRSDSAEAGGDKNGLVKRKRSGGFVRAISMGKMLLAAAKGSLEVFGTDPATWLAERANSILSFRKATDESFPLEHVLEGISAERREEILTRACADPLTSKLDVFTRLVLQQLDSVDFTRDVSYWDGTCGDHLSQDASHPKKRLKLDKLLGFNIPDKTEEAGTGPLVDLATKLESAAVSGFLNHGLPIFDNFEDQRFFASNEEAAVYFQAMIRTHCPPSREVVGLGFNRPLHLEGSIVALAFSGVGQLWLKGVRNGTWPDREAAMGCPVPVEARYVIDVSGMADFNVREGYERYGGAVFFDAKRQPIASWVAPDATLVTPDDGDEEWAFALWRVKTTLYAQNFTIDHLTRIHWLVSNSMVIAVRECLSPGHPLRRLLWPFTHAAVSINHAAITKLTGPGGAVTRVTAFEEESVPDGIARVAKNFRYESFEETLARKGLSSEDLESLPLAVDGRALVLVMEAFVDEWLSLHYPEGKGWSIADDPEVAEFYARADLAAMGEARPLGLPPMTRTTLRDYIVHFIFHVTALHELQGNILIDVSVPTTVSNRIMPREWFVGPCKRTSRPQATVGDYLRICGISIVTTAVPMPRLLPAMEDMATRRTVEGGFHGAAEGAILERFVAGLKAVDANIATANATAPRSAMPFGSFSPKILELSCSL